MKPLLRIQVEWEGHLRTVLLAIPEGEGPFPLVLALHGTGESPRLMAHLTGLPRLAHHAPFILALPSALGEQGVADFTKGAAWNAGPGYGCPDFPNSDDLGFLLALLDRLLATMPVDPARVYACGFSNGGRMVYRLLFEAADRFAAFAVIASAPGLPIPDQLPPRGLLIFHGTEDPYVLYQGGVGFQGHPISSSPVETTFRQLAAAMGLSGEIHRRGLGPHGCCSVSGGGAEVALWTVQNQGHAWPGGRAWSSEAEPPAADLPASELIWDFFRSRSLS